ncbi:MAG: hypothetical protein WDO24_02045 [Pseudomonadota bacterium]
MRLIAETGRGQDEVEQLRIREDLIDRRDILGAGDLRIAVRLNRVDQEGAGGVGQLAARPCRRR